ncbi:winged helix-turn-helix transcriptional regulator [Fodinicola acaciae]|uniref:winged helix-turn-helix transcriptional regulator n=1 Tax=Fodinicola acaciae TaxID=2681555 RepID=UPI0013D4AA2A|nr:helix-turn-helix domain-containing protein [Fodinicola acaciae]
MLGRTYEGQHCSIAKSLEVVGERWSLLILRDVFTGAHRFDELQKSLGITRSVLSSRLDHLVQECVLERRRYQTRPDRYEYLATDKGLALWPVLMHLLDWGDRYYAGKSGPPRIVEHDGCGGRMNSELCCDTCGERLWPQTASVHPARLSRPRSRR